MHFTELGMEHNNYSNNGNNLKYTDYREAMTNTHLVSNHNITKKYTNLKELKSEREKKVELNNEEIKNYEMFKSLESIKEEKRLENIRKQDIMEKDHHDLINKVLKYSDKKLRIKN